MSDCPNCGEKELLLVEEVYICGACGMEYKDRDIPHATKLHRRIDELTAKFAALREQVVYVVTMYRFGDREKHSYVYGAFSNENIAREWSEKEKDYRGGKYEPEIIRFCVDSPTDFLKVKNA